MNKNFSSEFIDNKHIRMSKENIPKQLKSLGIIHIALPDQSETVSNNSAGTIDMNSQLKVRTHDTEFAKVK